MGIFYFKTCCPFPEDKDNYFGISYGIFDNYIVGNTYLVTTSEQLICGVFVEQPVPSTSPVYYDIIDIENLGDNCEECLQISPCEKPSPTPTPTQPLPVNECDVITIFPMGIECVGNNPTTPISTDGDLSLIITGGTPPYTVFWDNGNISLAIQNLTVGSYTATVVDYYGDFSATTTCILSSDYDCSFSGTAVNVSGQTFPNGTGQNYLVTITSGTSIGPYIIYYDEINENNIATKSLYYTPATGVTLSELTFGYTVLVPNNATVLIIYNVLCDTNVQIPVESSPTLYDFCIVIDGDFAIHFNPNGIVNGKQSWISDDGTYFVIWDLLFNYWKITTTGLFIYQIVSNSPYPPLSGWYTIGGGNGNLVSYEGNCSITNPLAFKVITNMPTCECDGSLIFAPDGGTPPYQYSIDNGVTQSSSPIFSNLCSGTYTLVLTDSNSASTYNTIVLTNSQQPITYSVSITPVVTTITNTPTLKTNQIVATVNVTPPLPSGVSITLKLNHSNVFSTAPATTASTITTNTVLTINGIPQGAPLSVVGNSTTQNTIPGCQNTTIYKTTSNEIWNSVVVNSGSVVALNTTTTVAKTLVNCAVGESFDSYNITTASISGCSCCDVKIINSNVGPSGSAGGSTTGGVTT